MAEIRAQSGTQFDPQMVVVFEQVMAAEGDAARFTLVEKVPA
jgi:HD-GYP domain-containing protein (c-di-GMP phosphodiesterase class II)